MALTHAPSLLALALLALPALAPAAQALPDFRDVRDLLQDLPDPGPEPEPDVIDWVQCLAKPLCGFICKEYTSEDGTLPVGHGDGRYRGVYRRTHFDGEHWHYEGYGISPRMSCKPS